MLSINRSHPQVDLVTGLVQLCTILLKILADRSKELGDAFVEHVKTGELDDLYEIARHELAVLKVQQSKE